MNRRHFITFLFVAVLSVNAAPPSSEADKAAAIAAVKAYLAAIRAKDFGGLYERHFHSAARPRTTKEQFIQRMEAGFATTLEQLCVAILAAHDAGAGLSIGPMDDPLVPGRKMCSAPKAQNAALSEYPRVPVGPRQLTDKRGIPGQLSGSFALRGQCSR